MEEDDRVCWIVQRAALTLEIPEKSIYDYLNAADNSSPLLHFCSKDQTAGSTFIFSCEKWMEDVLIEEVTDREEEEIVSTEEGEGNEGFILSADQPIDKPTPAEAVVVDSAVVGSGEEVNGDENEVENTIPLKEVLTRTRIESVQRVRVITGMDRLAPEFQDKLAVYFMRTQGGDVPSRGVMASTLYSSLLGDHFDFLVMAGDLLYCMANTLSRLYLPVVEKAQGEYSGLPDLDDALKHELTSNMSKFEQQLRLTTSSRGDVKLMIPSISVNLAATGAVAEDYEIVSQIEAAMEDWKVHMAAAVEYEHQKQCKHGSPLAEIEFWRDRSTSLSAIYEQLTTPKVQQMLQVMKAMENPQLG